jgi:hypothetical protein
VLCLGLLDHVARPLALFELMAGVGAELIVVESEVSRARESLFELTRLYDTRDAVGAPMVLIPSPRALADLAGQYGFASVALAPDFPDDTGMSDYRRHRRLAFICSTRLPLDGLPAAAPGGIVPWWVRDPRALLSA